MFKEEVQKLLDQGAMGMTPVEKVGDQGAAAYDNGSITQDEQQPSRLPGQIGKQVDIDLTNLQPYVGTKMVKAKAMTGEDFAAYSGRSMGSGEGMLVVYKDGFKSWSPKDVFDDAYAPTENLTWGLVETQLDKPIIAARKCWFTAGVPMQVVTQQVASDISLEVVPKMTSLNDAAKEYVTGLVQQPLKYRGQLLLININGYATTYVPDGFDRIATDWMIKGLDF